MTLSDIDQLYRESWATQSGLFGRLPLLECATPVPCFGRWDTARVATAGMNPSEREFLDDNDSELLEDDRRFLHRRNSAADCTDDDIADARRLAEGYFELGNYYEGWFDKLEPFLDELGLSFAEGEACHTDYVSPFATTSGIGSLNSRPARKLARDHGGIKTWQRMLAMMPELEMSVGFGAGWKIMPKTLEFDRWSEIETGFDSKGEKSPVSPPYLLHHVVNCGSREIDLFWWKPNMGNPLEWLNASEKQELARVVAAHAQS